MTEGEIARFWAKVDKSGDCWLWTAYRSRRGYGRFNINWRQPPSYAHRVAYELEVGPIPDGLWVLHRCDNPPCVRPSHLFLGTTQDNTADMDRKGRRAPRRMATCMQGHPWTEATTGYHNANRPDRRYCKVCRRDRWAERRAAAA